MITKQGGPLEFGNINSVPEYCGAWRAKRGRSGQGITVY